LALHAERVGATILLEAAETEFTSYINTMNEVLAWVDRIGSPAFAPMLDTHQLYGAERSIEAGIRAARGRAQHIHLFEPSRYPPGVLVGKPILDWPRIGQLLREEGLPGSASVVIASEGDPEPVARASVAYLRRLFAS
jgi:sugar phosphate isomerase/epimerase